MNLLAQQIVNGLAIGSQYALWAVGYGLVFQILGLMHFAHGDTLLLSLYIAFALVTMLFLPFWLSAIIVLIVAGVLAMMVYRIAYKPLVSRGEMASAFIAALATAFILRNVATVFWGQASRVFPATFPANIVSLHGIVLNVNSFIALGTAIGVVAVFTLFLRYSRYGQAIVYLAQDRDTATLMGIPVTRMITLVYAISGVIGMVGALLFVTTYGAFDSTVGFYITFKAFLAAMIGGIGRIEGALAGGFVLGILESLIIAYISPLYVDAIVFAILGGFLLIRPSGLFGRSNILRP